MSSLDQLSQLRQIHDRSFDTPDTAAFHLQNAKAFPFTLRRRDRPCADCSVMHGLYSDIAASCRKHLGADGRIAVAEAWDCHSGGRCQGAALVLLAP